ncbi:hypothetical protein HKX48_002172 [Thoreauomyces humboldtii]|nr:hypothetical protein HKX48_002172 [Thoreauomyces humboldtii]
MPFWFIPARTLVATTVAAASVQFAVAAVSVPLRTDMVYDLSGYHIRHLHLCFLYYPSLSAVGVKNFLSSPVAALSSLPPLAMFHPRQLILSAMTLVWATRLGSHLFVRAIEKGGDPRFDEIKKNRLRFWGAFFDQVLWDFIGFSIWALGFAFEVVADRQKAAHAKALKDKKTDESFLRTGLWGLCRFPNYFGECSLWTGAYIASLGVFSAGTGYLSPWSAVCAAAAPAFETLLITKMSGIPLIQKYHDKKHGKKPEYQEYKKNVPTFFPKLL